jgi:hypothetical protein
MATKVAQMTKNELRDMISNLIEQKMLELIGDPDEKSVLKKSLRLRLLRQKKAVSRGERGQSFKDITHHLKLA